MKKTQPLAAPSREAKRATRGRTSDVPHVIADACHDARLDAAAAPVPTLDAITEAAVARATEAALGRVAAIVGPALEKLERATAALSPERITLLHPSGAAIEIGFSDLGFPRITLRDTTGAERLKMGLGMYHDEDGYEGDPEEPPSEGPEFQMQEADGELVLALAGGNRHSSVYARRGDMVTEMVPEPEEILAADVSYALQHGAIGVRPHMLQKLLRHEMGSRRTKALAWDAKLAAMMAILEAPPGACIEGA